MRWPEQVSPASAGTKRRLAWLLACLVVGGFAGATGSALTGNAYWYLAIPAAIAAGWLFVADPEQCERPARREGSAPPDEHRGP